MDDLLNEFLTETSESIAIIDVELVNLEKDPEDQEILSKIFRLVHTIKGTCGFLGLPRLEELAHAGEDVLGKIRDGEMGVSPETVTLILSSIDRIKENLDYIEENETEPDGDDKDLIVQLRAAAAGEAIKEPPVEENVEEDSVEDDSMETDSSEAPVTSEDGFPVAAEFLAEFEEVTASSTEKDEEVLVEEDAVSEEDSVVEDENTAENVKQIKEEATKVPVLVKDEKKQVKVSKKQKETSVADQSIRVNVELLENLMTLVSELVLTRNQLLQMVRDSSDSEFAAPLQSLSHITTDLQEGVMKTRMQPVGNAWAKLPRIVRDLSIESGKKIDLQMIGADTELDRQVLELIKDPLTHMVRNSADHGLESTKERIAVGKSEVGVIVLNAYHEGGHIIIEINDDGKGLNIERIREKAIENGLATEAELEAMTEHQIAQFVFRAGFSTAEKITSISGRGVGMDVVRTNIEKIGGSVELKTVTGKGTSFVIKIPLTLAIVSALVVASSSERFAIPQISVLELVRVTENSEFSIENLNASPVLRLRDRLLPLVNLADLLQLKDKKVYSEDDEAETETEETFIVVSQVGTYTFGIIVDRVFDTEEIVVKPVAPILRHITMFSGNTILGDGSVIMILDPNGIASAAGEVATTSDSMTGMEKKKKARSDESTSLLVFRAGGSNLKAVPLNLVARLEEIKVEDIEDSQGRPVIQYRGQLMPLITLDGVSKEIKTEGRQPILVFSDGERSMGLIVDEIVDIADDKLNVELEVEQEGMIGTAVVEGKAMDIIDIRHYLTIAFGDWFSSIDRSLETLKDKPSLLLVDDSTFFRNLMIPLLSARGYNVVSAESAVEALQMRDNGEQFDVIISDIVMPDMDGFEFAENIRADGIWMDTALIALSSHASEKDLKHGHEVGFDDYVSKFDQEAILSSLQEVLNASVDA